MYCLERWNISAKLGIVAEDDQCLCIFHSIQLQPDFVERGTMESGVTVGIILEYLSAQLPKLVEPPVSLLLKLLHFSVATSDILWPRVHPSDNGYTTHWTLQVVSAKCLQILY